jgi:hypothetical protein
LSGDAITVNVASSNFTSVYVNSISDYKTLAPFDPNAAIPNIQTGGGSATCSWTTSNANDIIYGFADDNSTSPDTGFSLLSDSNATSWFLFGEYQSVVATQSATSAPTLQSQAICDAIQKGP